MPTSATLSNVNNTIAGAGTIGLGSSLAVVSGGTLTLSWPADHIGWRLQSQTNALDIGLNPASAAWSDVAGSTSVNSVNVTVDPSKGTVFYRMIYP